MKKPYRFIVVSASIPGLAVGLLASFLLLLGVMTPSKLFGQTTLAQPETCGIEQLPEALSGSVDPTKPCQGAEDLRRTQNDLYGLELSDAQRATIESWSVYDPAWLMDSARQADVFAELRSIQTAIYSTPKEHFKSTLDASSRLFGLVESQVEAEGPIDVILSGKKRPDMIPLPLVLYGNLAYELVADLRAIEEGISPGALVPGADAYETLTIYFDGVFRNPDLTGAIAQGTTGYEVPKTFDAATFNHLTEDYLIDCNATYQNASEQMTAALLVPHQLSRGVNFTFEEMQRVELAFLEAQDESLIACTDRYFVALGEHGDAGEILSLFASKELIPEVSQRHSYSDSDQMERVWQEMKSGMEALEIYGGNLAPGQTVDQPSVEGYQASVEGRHWGRLVYSNAVDFDLELHSRDKQGAWVKVAGSDDDEPRGVVSFQGPPGEYKWQVISISGSGDYSFLLSRPEVE